MKRTLALLVFVLLLAATGCSGDAGTATPPAGSAPAEATQTAPPASEPSPADSEAPEAVGGSIILSTTTSTQDSGLLDYLLPIFKDETGIDVRTVAVGTGKALEMGRNGEADVLLVHAKASEEELVAEGFGIARYDVMYNDFILVGPKGDPLGLKELNVDIAAALLKIKEAGAVFVSRGDDSGTHKKELEIWNGAGVEPAWNEYLSVGQGMGDTLRITSEKQGYTLTDRATFLAMRDALDLDILLEGAASMLNQYGVIRVNPDKFENINAVGAARFQEWLLSEPVQLLISQFGMEEYGEPLFFPNAE